jgi:hypothetical protein
MSTTDGPSTPVVAGGRRPLYSIKGRIAVAVLLAIAAGALVLAITRTQTGADDPVAESGGVPLDGFGVRPQRNAEVLRQVEIGIDLKPGWEATLVVDGVEIPRGQQRIVAPEHQVFFTPGEGRVVEQLRAGERCVTAIYWHVSTGRGVDDGRYRWCFKVT